MKCGITSFQEMWPAVECWLIIFKKKFPYISIGFTSWLDRQDKKVIQRFFPIFGKSIILEEFIKKQSPCWIQISNKQISLQIENYIKSSKGTLK